MTRSAKWATISAIALVAGLYSGLARSDDASVIDDRQAFMKAQSKDIGAIKAFTEDKGDLVAAQTAGADLVTRIPKIPDMFPKGTGLDAYPGKSYAKPAIWTDHDKFLAADKDALAAAEALNTALKSGDKAALPLRTRARAAGVTEPSPKKGHQSRHNPFHAACPRLVGGLKGKDPRFGHARSLRRRISGLGSPPS